MVWEGVAATLDTPLCRVFRSPEAHETAINPFAPRRSERGAVITYERERRGGERAVEETKSAAAGEMGEATADEREITTADER